MLSFTDHVWEEGSENIGGTIGGFVYFIPASQADVSALACVDGITVTGDLTPVGAQDAIKVYVTDGTMNITDTQQGETDGESTLSTLSFFTPGSKKDLAILKRKIKVPGIWFFRDSDYNWRTLGLTAIQDPDVIGTYEVTKDLQCRVTAIEGTHGTRGADRKGTTITATQISPHESLFYEGVIPHADFIPPGP